MWKLLSKEVDLGEPITFLDHVYLGSTQRQFEISKHIVDNCRTMFESRIYAERISKSPCTRKIFVFFRGLTIWGVMQRSVWNEIVSWRTKRLNNSPKYLLHALIGGNVINIVLIFSEMPQLGTKNYIGKRFCKSTCIFIFQNCINCIRSKSRSIHPQWRKVKGQNKFKIWVWTVSQKFSHL